ncbi:MAG: carboxypeptidase regulatory-like domain-containing protein [Planctomycetaceae bacterium]
MQRLETSLLAAFSKTCFAIIALAVVNGCSDPFDVDYDDLNLATVSGTITLDDKPLAGARVIFESPDKTYSYGITDNSGSYSLMFNSEQNGVTSGEKVVRITMGGALDETEFEDGDESDSEDASVPSGVTIPERYNRKSTLAETVDSGAQTFDFELKSAR